MRTTKDIKALDKMDVTLNQFCNAAYEVKNFVVIKEEYEDDPDMFEFTFNSMYKPEVFLLPKYAFAKVRHFEYVAPDTLRIYVDLEG